MIIVVLEDEEALSILIAGRAMQAAYERDLKTEEEAYLQLRVGLEKIDLELWGT